MSLDTGISQAERIRSRVERGQKGRKWWRTLQAKQRVYAEASQQIRI